MASSSSSNLDKTQIQIKLYTKQPQYSVADIPYAVPASITTKELNSLVNQLINESDLNNEIKKPIQFDFLAADEFIKTTLNEHITNRGLSTETLLPIEYVECLPSPKPLDCLLHDDWVSAVHCSEKWILTGCYDNTLHLWTINGRHLLTIPGHSGAVKGVCWINADDDLTTFISASRDQTLLLWNWNTNENKVECVKTCKGHSEAVECVDVSVDKQKFASGGWDNMLKIWSTSMDDKHENNDSDVDDDYEGSNIKKMKNDRKSHIKVPKTTLKGHKEAITSISWLNSDDLVTASMDHTIRLWDIEMSTMINEIVGSKAFLDVHISPKNKLMITASSDKYIRLYDCRSSDGNICKNTFTSHNGWVTTVRWSTIHEHLFISGSYDFQVKLWDTRSPKVPMYDLTGHEDNILCSDWTNNSIIASGGADNSLRIYTTTNFQKTVKEN